MSIADKLITIADNVSAVAQAVDAARVRVEGSSVRAEGVAEFPVKVQLKGENHFTGVGVKAYGKNLLSKDDYYYRSMELNGVTFTVNNDGSITVNGTATKTTTFYIIGGYSTEVIISINQKLRKGVPYTVSDNPPGASFSTYCIQYSINDRYYSPLNSTRTFTMTSDADVLTRMYITVNAGVTVDNITFHPQIEVGTAATDFEPYKAPQTAQADSTGKVTGIVPVVPTMTVVADSGTVQAAYLPEGEIWQKYQEYKTTLVALKEELT